MKKYFLFFSTCLLVIFNSCNNKKTIDYSLLEGDWMFVNIKTKDVDAPPLINGTFPLSLRNYKGDIYDSIYKVINDTIFFKYFPRHGEKIENRWYSRFVIKSITKDTLIVSSIKDSTNCKLYNSDLLKDTSIHVSRICFSSSGCYGTCPSMNIELNKNGAVYFQGQLYTKMQGDHIGKISNTAFHYFEELIQKTGLEKLDSINEDFVTDNQAIGLRIFYNNGKIKNIYIYPAFRFDFPFLNQLDYNLLRFDNYCPLVKSDTTYSFFYNKFPKGFRVSIAETPAVKFTPPSE